MSLLEYAGADGFELCDQICQSNIDGTLRTHDNELGLRAER